MTNRTDPRPSDDRAAQWRLRGEQDSRDARYDPPADPDDRRAYDAGYQRTQELTP